MDRLFETARGGAVAFALALAYPPLPGSLSGRIAHATLDHHTERHKL